MLPFALINLVLFQALIARHRERRLVACVLFAALLLMLALGVGSALAGALGAAQDMILAQVSLVLACLGALRVRGETA